jgi:vanillate O-demethylase monooxygenase subunit
LRDCFTVAANYEIITDNLMDLSHADFVHRDSFGTNDALIDCGQQTVRQDEDAGIGGAIWNNWDMAGAPPQEWQKPMLPPGSLTNQRLHMRWHAPATMALHITFENAANGAAIVPPMANPHIITPETQNSSHYFYTREHGEDAEAMFRKAFLEEDKPMLEAVHAALGGEDFWEARPLVLEADAGAIRARRRLMQLRKGEA